MSVTIKADAGLVTFGDTEEGMFGLRVASSLDVKRKQGGKITNAVGVTDQAAWARHRPGATPPGRSKAGPSASLS